ncbi:hypothetical protein Sjap_017948 [Stephania japonica]|uniref:Lipoyl-binding domain-containing protein n=1 Tax=Stephania japonica TaxID=461633 RepID=A0AAP0I738_9MAGN
MVDLEGQDHGPSSSSVGDNDDDFIVYSKEGNNARWFKKEGDEVSAEDILCEVETDNAIAAMECTEEVFLAKIIHGDGAKVIKVVNATTVEDEDDIAKFKDYKPSQSGDSKEAKVPFDPSQPTPPKKEDTELRWLTEPKSQRLLMLLNQSMDFRKSSCEKIGKRPQCTSFKDQRNGSRWNYCAADIEDYLGGTFTVSNWEELMGSSNFAHHQSPTTGILAVGSCN